MQYLLQSVVRSFTTNIGAFSSQILFTLKSNILKTKNQQTSSHF